MNEQVSNKPGLSIVLDNYKSFEMTSICLDLISKAVIKTEENESDEQENEE